MKNKPVIVTARDGSGKRRLPGNEENDFNAGLGSRRYAKF